MRRRINEVVINCDVNKKRTTTEPTVPGINQLIREGEILTDITTKKWRVGKSIGSGAFGVIYNVSENIYKPVDSNVQYVVKIEPQENGPLFVEMHFYLRAAQKEMISEWQIQKKVDRVGLSPYYTHGSHTYKGNKYRFLILEKYGQDLQKLFVKSNHRFDSKTAFSFANQVLDTLEYIHSKGYIHVDIKGSNLLVGYPKQYSQKIFLIDFGLACKFRDQNGNHHEFNPDQRKAHDGTLEYTSRDAHLGAHSRRGDLEILGYNLLYWLTGKLPWIDDLNDPEKVHQQKEKFMSNLKQSLKNTCLDSKPFEILHRYLKYVNSLQFETEPNYDYCRDLFMCGIKNINLKGLSIPKTKGIKRLRDEEPENLLNLKKKKTIRFESLQPCFQNSNRHLRNSISTTPVLRSRQFNWEKVLSSHPEKNLKIKKIQKYSSTIKSQISPKKQFVPETLVTPTPAMLEVISLRKSSLNKSSKSKTDSRCLSPLDTPISCRPGYNTAMEMLARSLEETKKKEAQLTLKENKKKEAQLTLDSPRLGRKWKKINKPSPKKLSKTTSKVTCSDISSKKMKNNNIRKSITVRPTEILISRKNQECLDKDYELSKIISISHPHLIYQRVTRTLARQLLKIDISKKKKKIN